jgi:hypothetical protein
MTGDALPVPRLWAAATTSGTDHGGGGAEFRQRRPLGTGAPGAVIECIIGYRVWLGDNCACGSAFKLRICPAAFGVGGNFPGFGIPTLPLSDGPMERDRNPRTMLAMTR